MLRTKVGALREEAHLIKLKAQSEVRCGKGALDFKKLTPKDH